MPSKIEVIGGQETRCVYTKAGCWLIQGRNVLRFGLSEGEKLAGLVADLVDSVVDGERDGE